ncbi:hypothetical protein IEC97_01320 [Neobacillus cucumis]|uniref:hypothetical protein n=1 Tax=Neobacillus cucumis TaxID=1740721 RepID=UPI0018E0106C|nr:hypothetical protein [Neobacillus cucumis]MBI0575984.1 hypothetical protein [Neobacillus cucumis]
MYHLWKGAKKMSFNINRINPNQTQVFFHDGRFETLTNEELEDFLLQMGISEVDETTEQSVTD